MTNHVPHHGVTSVPGLVKSVQIDTCLHEKLLKGSDFLNKLFGILLRLQQELYAVISDIEQMYHQIKVAENNQDALWRDNTDKEIVNHMMKVHIIGKIDSHFIVNWVIERKMLDRSSQNENEITEIIKQNLYMDDYLWTALHPK